MSQLTKEEIKDIRNAIDFLGGIIAGTDNESLVAVSIYNAAMDAVKKLENQDDEK